MHIHFRRVLAFPTCWLPTAKAWLDNELKGMVNSGKILSCMIISVGSCMFDIDYYEDAAGHKPIEDFIEGLDCKMKAKVFGRIALLEEYGSRLGMPFSRHLGDGIFELRTSQGSDITRILYFFFVGKRIIFTHGFVKKTQKTPKRELERAKRMRKDWEKRHG